jgi:hypothetical protein
MKNRGLELDIFAVLTQFVVAYVAEVFSLKSAKIFAIN